jgi:peroxiredoxin
MKRIAVVLAIVMFSLVAGCKEKPQRVVSGAEAPDFVLNDISGKPVRLSDFRGKVVLLEFWATWCAPCVMAIPELNELQEKYLDEDFVMLAVSADDDIEALESFYEEYHITYPVLFDDKGVNNDFGIYSLPTSIIIGKDGKISKRHMGYAPDVLDELVSEALAEENSSQEK